ncbi:MAG TPA: ribosome biogenesis GTPase Der [Polyangiaceae bacterium]|nr:ribosome biogenesis GTPase Der [Polyangiaceae bacterium]
MKPIVAIVGRPNVGKSTLFNRLVGKNLAIVHDLPGVTRDRHYADALIGGREITLVDTGGFDPESEDPMQAGIVRHVLSAIEEADAVLCVLDGSMPPTGPDREAVALLRQSEKPTIFVANKVDTKEHELGTGPLYELGLPEVIPVSALHGRGTAEIGRALRELLPKAPARAPEEGERAPRIALIGRPNAGKSSLFNRLVGEERSLVDARPGTTRDPVDERIEFQGRPFLVVDTAGIRRRPNVERGVELVSVLRAIRALERAEVCVLVCDSTEGVTQQDARLLALAAERRRAVVVALNKTDLLDPKQRREAVTNAEETLAFARWITIVPISARTGDNVPKLMRTVERAAAEMRRRVGTSELNRFFEEVLARHPPPTHKGQAPRIYYVTQAETSPPVFVAVSSHPEHIKPSYQRFVANQIRKAFGFESVPITVHYRMKRRRE